MLSQRMAINLCASSPTPSLASSPGSTSSSGEELPPPVKAHQLSLPHLMISMIQKTTI